MRLSGLFVPTLTPFDEDGSFDARALAGHVEWLLAGGVDGIVALGTTGEFADLVPDERAEVVQATVKAVGGRVPVLAGVGGVGTAEAQAHARQAADAGADAMLALPPLYWKLGEDGLVRHFAAVADATDRPLVLYDLPALSGTPLTPSLIARVAAEVPQAAGVKLSGPELRVAHGVLAQVKTARPDFAVLLGATDLLLPGLLAGADGTIAAIGNVAPRVLADLLAAHEGGTLDEARDLHRRLLDLLAIPALSSPPILALKAAAQAAGSPLQPRVRTQPSADDDVVQRAAQLASRLLS